MQITTFTARKQIGFKLPKHAFAALKALESRGGLLAGYSLETNLISIDHVASSTLSFDPSSTVYVDFHTGPDESVPTIDDVAAVIAEHAQAALAIDRFIPGLIQRRPVSGEQCFADGSAPRHGTPPNGQLIHVDEHFIVMVDKGTSQTGSVHYLRNGKPAWTHLDDLTEMSHVFAKVIDLDSFGEVTGPIMATRSLDSVTSWIMEKAYVPDLENDRSYDLEDHPLRDVVTSGTVVYADVDVVVTGSGQRLTIHHTDDDGRYGVKVLEGDAAASLKEAIATPGLDVLDETNPARVMIDAAIEERRLYLATRDLPGTPSAAIA